MWDSSNTFDASSKDLNRRIMGRGKKAVVCWDILLNVEQFYSWSTSEIN